MSYQFEAFLNPKASSKRKVKESQRSVYPAVPTVSICANNTIGLNVAAFEQFSSWSSIDLFVDKAAGVGLITNGKSFDVSVSISKGSTRPRGVIYCPSFIKAFKLIAGKRSTIRFGEGKNAGLLFSLEPIKNDHRTSKQT